MQIKHSNSNSHITWKLVSLSNGCKGTCDPLHNNNLACLSIAFIAPLGATGKADAHWIHWLEYIHNENDFAIEG